MAMQAGPVREHGGHYKRRYVHIRTAQNLNLDMDLYLAGELSARNLALKAKEFTAVQANAVNTALTFMQKKMLAMLTGRYAVSRKFFSRWFYRRRADARKGKVIGLIRASGPRSVPIEDFPHEVKGPTYTKKGKLKKRGGLYVKIRRDEGVKLVEGAFSWSPHGGDLYFARKGKKRLPIERKFTTSGLEYLVNEENHDGPEAREMNREGMVYLQKELTRQLDNRLAKIAARMAAKGSS